MHPRVGSARSDQDNFLVGRHFNSLLDLLLNRTGVRLNLPALKTGAVFFDDKFEVLLHRQHVIYMSYKDRTSESEKKDSIVDKTMVAEARAVSLLSCEESTYMAVEDGSAKNIILTLKGSPVTLKAPRRT